MPQGTVKKQKNNDLKKSKSNQKAKTLRKGGGLIYILMYVCVAGILYSIC